jgi:hypothetical protein
MTQMLEQKIALRATGRIEQGARMVEHPKVTTGGFEYVLTRQCVALLTRRKGRFSAGRRACALSVIGQLGAPPFS